MNSEIILPQVSSIFTVGSCFLLSVTYVASLYVWNSEHNRDHPSTIKKRFCSVSVVMLISPLFVYFTSHQALFERATIWEVIGFRKAGLFSAILFPLLLTVILFLGPLSLQVSNGVWNLFSEPKQLLGNLTNVLWLRNHIVAPLSEEFTFRACMLPLLMQSFKPSTAVLIQPLFFGIAHFHHMVERLKTGMNKKTAIITSCFQFTYTTIFGIYSAYLFAKTGHFFAPFIAHAFCNHMGFPDFQEVFNQDKRKKNIFLSIYVIGLVSWIILLPILTTPSWYSNTLYWKS